MKRRRFFETLTAALLAVTMLTGVFALAQGKGGKGGGGGDDGGGGSAPPPISYEITWFGNLGGDPFYVSDINNWGQIAGSGWDETNTRVAYVLLPAGLNVDGVLDYSNAMIVDINDMFELDSDGNPTTTPTVPADWRANRAESINDLGEVTGTLWNGTVRAIYKLDLASRSMTVIDTDVTGDATINDMGEISYGKLVDGETYVHLYLPATDTTDEQIVKLGITGSGEINNVGQIGGKSSATRKPYRYTPGEPLLEFGKKDEFRGTGRPNDSGTVILYRDIRDEAIRYSDAQGYKTISKGYGSPKDINNSGDVLLEAYDHGTLYMDEFGLLGLDDLVTGSTEDLALWFSRDTDGFAIFQFNNRNETGFAEICGVHSFGGVQVGFILRPVTVLAP